MKFAYDQDADFYARFAPDGTPIAETKEVAPNVNIDLDERGNLVASRSFTFAYASSVKLAADTRPSSSVPPYSARPRTSLFQVPPCRYRAPDRRGKTRSATFQAWRAPLQPRYMAEVRPAAAHPGPRRPRSYGALCPPRLWQQLWTDRAGRSVGWGRRDSNPGLMSVNPAQKWLGHHSRRATPQKPPDSPRCCPLANHLHMVPMVRVKVRSVTRAGVRSPGTRRIVR